MEIESFYKQLLGLGDHWIVTGARLEMGAGEVVLSIEHEGKGHVCPECGKPAKLHDHAPESRGTGQRSQGLS